METDISQELQSKIREAYGLEPQEAAEKAASLLLTCPPPLRPNLSEWAEGKPLSDIFVGRYSLPMVLSLWHSRDFLRAAGVMSELWQGSSCHFRGGRSGNGNCRRRGSGRSRDSR